MELAVEFFRLFAGLERAHGRYVVPPGTKPNEKGKIEPAQNFRSTIKEGATIELWRKHLDGSGYGLGIVPITDNETCRWGAIDVDVYGIDLLKLNQEVQRLKLPLIVARTKSGGAHLYFFGKDFLPAALVRSKLMDWAVALGFPGVEVFPKQTRLAGEHDWGSWLNMPYYGNVDERSMRYGIDAGGSRLPAPAFVLRAQELALDEEELAQFMVAMDQNVATELKGGPPCLKVLTERGFPDGTRNNGLFNFGVYAKRRFPDTWANEVAAFNQRHMHPPLEQAVVNATIKSLRKKGYSYRCKEPPINAVCNRQICLTCEYGVGNEEDDPGVVFGDMLKIDFKHDPLWIWTINGKRIELTIDDLVHQQQFKKKVGAQLNLMPRSIKQNTWERLVDEHMKRAELVAPPEDTKEDVQLLIHLQRYCTGRAIARTLEEMMMGKPFTDPQDGRTYFQAVDFIEHLRKQGINGLSVRDVFSFLRDHEVQHHTRQIKGKRFNCWSIPKFEQQTEPFEPPRTDEAPM